MSLILSFIVRNGFLELDTVNRLPFTRTPLRIRDQVTHSTIIAVDAGRIYSDPTVSRLSAELPVPVIHSVTHSHLGMDQFHFHVKFNLCNQRPPNCALNWNLLSLCPSYNLHGQNGDHFSLSHPVGRG